MLNKILFFTLLCMPALDACKTVDILYDWLDIMQSQRDLYQDRDYDRGYYDGCVETLYMAIHTIEYQD